MPHVKDKDELWALVLLQRIIDRDQQDRDALPGSAVRHVKDAARILRPDARRRSARSNHKECPDRFCPPLRNEDILR